MTLKTQRLAGLFEIPTEMLRNGVLQAAIGMFPQPILPGTSVCSQQLVEDRWVCVVRQGHPGVRRKLSFSEFLKIEHIRVNYGETERPGFVGDALTSLEKEKGRGRRASLDLCSCDRSTNRSARHLATASCTRIRKGVSDNDLSDTVASSEHRSFFGLA